MKSSHPELDRVWQIGQSMWKRHWAQVHTDLKQEWSEDIKEIMEVLKGKSKSKRITFIML